mmetsp:Transcript_6822/g.25191  ORF Transcript_6822/g.25191 Transcript_6822/m.25191 type:complete len:88 (+) Transcript_6822:838-1101(+)
MDLHEGRSDVVEASKGASFEVQQALLLVQNALLRQQDETAKLKSELDQLRAVLCALSSKAGFDSLAEDDLADVCASSPSDAAKGSRP